MDNLQAITKAHPEYFILKEKIVFLIKMGMSIEEIEEVYTLKYNLTSPVLKGLFPVFVPLSVWGDKAKRFAKYLNKQGSSMFNVPSSKDFYKQYMCDFTQLDNRVVADQAKQHDDLVDATIYGKACSQVIMDDLSEIKVKPIIF